MTTQLAIRTDIRLKRSAAQKAKQHGLTLSFIINQLLKNYVEEDYEFFFRRKKEPHDEVTCDKLFFDRDIVIAANKLSDYLRHHPL